MRFTKRERMGLLLLISLVLSGALLAQPDSRRPIKVDFGQETKLEGVIVERGPQRLVVVRKDEAEFAVVLTPQTKIQEKKSNFLRGAKKYGADDLVVGLNVRVKGWGDADGNLVAKSLKFTQQELFVAESIASRLAPVEDELSRTRNRLDGVEGDVEQSRKEIGQLSGELDDVGASLQIARAEARQASDSANRALIAADSAHSRISQLDDFEVKETLAILFGAGSDQLSEQAIDSLNRLAEKTGGENGYLVEVVGYASADGGEAFNQRLSQKRAESVIRYLSDSGRIPLHRFIFPHGLGEKHPVGDNATREGRQKNRRVELRLLVNSGIQMSSESAGIR